MNRTHRERIPSRRRDAVRDEPLLVPPGPGGFFKLLYVGSLLAGAMLSLVLGFVGAFYVMAWLDDARGVALGARTILVIALAFAACLTALVVRIHAAVFRESGE